MLRFKEKKHKSYVYKGHDFSMATQVENEFHFDSELFQQQLPVHYRKVLSDFQKCSRGFFRFNLLFLVLFLVEIGSLIFSSFLAVTLSAMFLTVFTYLILLFYYQAKKPEQMNALLQGFLSSCRMTLGLPAGVAQHHLSVAETLIKLSQYLENYETKLIRFPEFFPPLSRFVKSLSALLYAKDVFHFKQQLLHIAIEEHYQQIRATPTDLEVHASLAGSFVALSQIYKTPFPPKHAKAFEEKFKASATLAIEEFRILSQYAPNDPWVHEQLAAGYRELNLSTEEIREVEILLKLRPQDKEILFRLGTLYFLQGWNAKGLQIYEELKKANYKKAEDLISTYGQTALSEPLFL